MLYASGNSAAIIENSYGRLFFDNWYYDGICLSYFINRSGYSCYFTKKNRKIFSKNILDILRGWEIKERGLDMVGGRK